MLLDTASITVMDGQNESAIAKYTDNEYHPCLAEPLSLDKEVTVTFGPDMSRFADWFPEMCWEMVDGVEYGNESYSNEFLFDGAQKWTIHNLVVDNYTATDYWYIIRSESEHAQFQCFNCSFMGTENGGSGHQVLN